MNEPIMIQVDDEVREATPEEADAIRAIWATAPTLPGADSADQ